MACISQHKETGFFLGLLEQYGFVHSPGLSLEELVESGRTQW